MGTAKERSTRNLRRTTELLSGMLTQEVKALNDRQKAARAGGGSAAGLIRELKEATAVLKDLAAVAKALNEQGTEQAGSCCGVVLLPPIEKGDGE